jgi:hypothetical protein
MREPDPRAALYAACLIVAAAFCLAAYRAWAHDWMTPEQKSYCCDDNHCKPYPRDGVKRTAEGWHVPRYGHLFPNGSPHVYPNPRPDLSEIFLCKLEWEEKPRCLFVTPEGS